MELKAILGMLGKSNPATAGMSMALGAGQMIAGSINRKKADSLLPPAEDPMERQMLNTLRRRRRALETGTANLAQTNAARQMSKQAMSSAFKAGGPVNQSFYSNLQSQTLGNIAAQSAQQYSQALGMEQSQSKLMADRRSDLSLLRSARKSAQAERQMQTGQQNIGAGLGNLFGSLDPSKIS
tara:strand:+ start:438 stop:983 length:546 start_codon:yes stop_codon:yes gene_type:complete